MRIRSCLYKILHAIFVVIATIIEVIADLTQREAAITLYILIWAGCLIYGLRGAYIVGEANNVQPLLKELICPVEGYWSGFFYELRFYIALLPIALISNALSALYAHFSDKKFSLDECISWKKSLQKDVISVYDRCATCEHLKNGICDIGCKGVPKYYEKCDKWKLGISKLNHYYWEFAWVAGNDNWMKEYKKGKREWLNVRKTKKGREETSEAVKENSSDKKNSVEEITNTFKEDSDNT